MLTTKASALSHAGVPGSLAMQRLALLRQILVSVRRSAGTFDCFGNLTKALTFLSERAACVAECRVSEHAGLIHAFDAGYDPGPQQQSTLFDQLGHFREVQLGIAEDLRGAVYATVKTAYTLP